MKRVVAWLLCAMLLVPLFTSCEKENITPSKPTEAPDNNQDTKTYMDHLEEKYANYTEMEYGLDITKKENIISICYSTWFTKILNGKTKNPPNITEILAGNQDWAGSPAFHYWAEPALGYYKSDNKEIIRTHMTQLYEAGVDFIIIDNTNAVMSWKNKGSSNWSLYITKPCTAILDTIVEMREEGLMTPYVVFWSKVDEEQGWQIVEETYNQFYTQDKWKDCFVYWEGKPLALATNMLDNPPEFFTIREMFGLRQELSVSEWSFLDIENKPSYDADGFVEQICVCVASQETYMSAPTAHGRNHGIFFYEQWLKAFEYRPKVITLTWWNEWAAQRIYIKSGPYEGQYHFTDAYNAEYSRDIEPMKGGHGDQYYKWMAEYIKAYREGRTCPRLVEAGY
ncbi:MAG: hypothetical protein E7385_07910 [Ruminococcaceae bacterium]|nr:hypothetical protein [Oscillospiraceae bacterium]